MNIYIGNILREEVLKAIRMGKWKGLILNIRKEGEDKMMLFNLETDPREQQDVAADHRKLFLK